MQARIQSNSLLGCQNTPPALQVHPPDARLARKMRPAQVPQMGRLLAANERSSGMSPHRSATSAIVVLSPPAVLYRCVQCSALASGHEAVAETAPAATGVARSRWRQQVLGGGSIAPASCADLG